jgi:hypothetical protein
LFADRLHAAAAVEDDEVVSLSNHDNFVVLEISDFIYTAKLICKMQHGDFLQGCKKSNKISNFADA